jgi:LmbE family N-acetylglucosaminyl deacetylase
MEVYLVQNESDLMNILAIGAHPDDVEYGCAGTLIRHVLRGDNVFIMIITDGAQGGDPAARREEQLAAVKIIGAQEVFFGDYPDTRSPRVDHGHRVGHKANPSRFGVHSLW